MTTSIITLAISDSESVQIRSLLADIKADKRLLDQYSFLEQAHLLAQELPRRVRETFYRFKREEREPVLHVTGSPVLLDGCASTPTRYVEQEPGYELNDAQLLHGLYGSLLGEAVGFTSQRNGSIFNNIIPLPELAKTANSSSGSAMDFGFHVEDAFHPARADYIGLVCMRNDEAAVTTISCIDGIELDEDERDVLFEPRFSIGHNPIHSTSGVVTEHGQPVLFGRRDRPYVRINAAALRLNEYQGLERRALERLLDYFVENKASIALRSRDCVYIDNFRCVHARDAYKAQFGPNARWLSRVVFTNDLRKSQTLRATAQTRAIAA
ncbi:TauD/TfdA family dioxygenase [Telmatospirillum sp.]|uniref:TauD/TfdA family dioxygenase n=1 Tax=Telmatospirillum sp. TaxID=2079197 RepID=UPI00284DF4B0|nr:TauD/TfdA family dioxygenase [Telmatospirillum sp.]MDR3440147.1 TauD/TfdA family dioxygenase [Telmatospirillum sp.]